MQEVSMCSTEATKTPHLLGEVGVANILETLAERIPNATAIASLGRTPLTYGRLLAHINDVAVTLNAIGVGRNDRVAIVLPNGPEMVTALLSVFCCATAAPVNPTYGIAELDFHVSDLNVKAVIIQEGSESPVKAIALQRNITVLELSPMTGAEAGTFKLTVKTRGASADTRETDLGDAALILHTSGTTSRPKIVPLSQGNLVSSADHIRTTLALTENDRCLTVMPLFHIHGLMVTLASLLAGGSVCPVHFECQNFFHCITEFAPTWYSAVPTIHQAVLRVAESHKDVIAGSRLRFVRSSSATLPARVKAELEGVFNAPVVEAYGMTEAAHQLASNPLPPSARKPGSVGLAAGPEIAIMDDTGNLLPPNRTGEIVAQGENIFTGYEGNPEANKDGFANGWFRTGDQGFLDSEGYLFITGRLKDIINRGGEKISPAEIDDILLSHPAIEQAVAFPVPHPSLGEDIFAAVVLQKDAVASDGEIREFLTHRIADFKVPQRVLILEEIPKGPTGKLQRHTLVEKLGLALDRVKRKSSPAYAAPIQTVEHQLVQIWEEFLGARPIGLHDSFFELGGDSLLAVQMMQRLKRVLGRDLPLAALLSGPTIAKLTKALVKRQFESNKNLLVTIQAGSDRHPFFFLHWDFEGGGFYCLELARLLGENQPFYALAPHGMNGERVPPTYEAMAASYIEMIRAVQPRGPYVVGGMCSGAVVAFEMAQQLTRAGEKVSLVVLVSPPAWNSPRMRYLQDLALSLGRLVRLGDEQKLDLFLRLCHPWFRLRHYSLHSVRLFDNIAQLQGREQVGLVFRLAKKIAFSVPRRFLQKCQPSRIASMNMVPVNQQVQRHPDSDIYFRSRAGYVRRSYAGRVVLFWPVDEPIVIRDEPSLNRDKMSDKTLGWSQVVRDLEVHEVPDSLYPLVTKHVRVLADRMKFCLDKVQDCGR